MTKMDVLGNLVAVVDAILLVGVLDKRASIPVRQVILGRAILDDCLHILLLSCDIADSGRCQSVLSVLLLES